MPKQLCYNKGMQNNMTINWTTAGGNEIEIEIGSNYMLNGQGRRKTSGELVVVVSATVNGVDHFAPAGYNRLAKPAGDVVAAIGKIGMDAARAAEVEAVIASVKAEIAAHNAALAAHAAKLDLLGTGDINQWELA